MSVLRHRNVSLLEGPLIPEMTAFAILRTLSDPLRNPWLLAAVGQFITVTIAYRRVSRTPAPEPAPAESP